MRSIGEWTASSHVGLGTYLLTANAQMNTAGVYGAMLLLTAIGIGSFLLVVIVAEHFATPWRTRMTAPSLFRRRGAGPVTGIVIRARRVQPHSATKGLR